MKILLSAYSCEPDRGSELEVGWKTVEELASTPAILTVVTKTSSKNAINRYLVLNGLSNTKYIRTEFIYFDLPVWFRKFKENSLIGAQIHCYLWEIGVFFFLLKKYKKNEFDLAYKITTASYRFPSFVWYFARKFVWGPFCSGEHFPLKFLSIYSWEGAGQELLRLTIRRLALLDPLVLLSLYKADHLITITHDTKNILPAFARRKAVVSIAKHNSVDFSAFDYVTEEGLQKSNHVKLLYIGRLLEWKGIMLALRALKEINAHVDYTFTIMGEGPAKKYYQAYATKYQLNVVFISPEGIPRRKLSAYYLSHDLFVFPGLHGTGGHVILEAQLHNLPVLMFDMTAPANFRQPDSDIIVSTNDRTISQIVGGIAHEILSFVRKNKQFDNIIVTNN